MSAFSTTHETVRLKRVFKIVNGATPSSGTEAYWNGAIPWVTPDDLGSLGARTISETRRRLTENGLANCGASIVPAGSLILSTRAPIGHLAITTVACCTNQGCKALVPKDGQVDSYFYYQLEALREILRARGRGSTFKELSTEDLSQVDLACPPPGVRNRIAAYLDRETARIDALVAEKETLLKLLEEKRASLISQAVTRGLDPKAKLKPSGIPWLGDVPEHWEICQLRHLITHLTSGSRGWSRFYSPSGDKFVRIGNLRRGSLEMDLDDVQHVSIPSDGSGESAERARLRHGDVLFSITAYLGSVGICPLEIEGAYVSQHIALTRVKQTRVLPEWVGFFALGNSGQIQLNEASYGGTKMQLALDDIRNFTLCRPPLNEQKEIIAFLTQAASTLDCLDSGIKSSITLLREKRASLISAAVTGEMEVP